MEAARPRLFLRAAWVAWALDVTLAALCAGAAVALATEIAPTGARGTAAVAVAGLHGLSVVLRRTAPWWMLVLLAATAVAYAALGLPVVFLGPAALVATYSVAAAFPRERALAALAAVEVPLTVLVLLGPGGLGLDSLVLFVGLVAVAWLLGDVVRRWRALAEANARQVEELEKARAELAAQALTLERLRIARELHDVVAHSMSMVAMHSGAARLAVGKDPVAESAALAVVEHTTREALAEMRRLVSVLREDAASGTVDGLAPAPGLSDLPRLVAGVEAVGLVVDVRTTGDLGEVPPGLSLTVHRVLQEALTNVARHVGPTRVQVDVDAREYDVLLSVQNEAGSGQGLPPAWSGGHGLQGMRERVQLYGGTLEAGPCPSGGWRVAARLPRGPAAT